MIVNLSVNDVAKFLAYGPVSVKSIGGSNGTATDLFVQFHRIQNGTPTIANNTVPLFGSALFPANTSASYGTNFFGTGGITFPEAVVAISTTPNVYTAVSAGSALTLGVEFDSSFPFDSSRHTISGDLTSNVAYRLLWVSGIGAYRLLKARIITGGSTIAPFIQAQSSPNAAKAGILCKPIAPGTDKTLDFGGGIIPRENDAGTLLTGCTIGFLTCDSLTQVTQPYVAYGTSDVKILAVREIIA